MRTHTTGMWCSALGMLLLHLHSEASAIECIQPDICKEEVGSIVSEVRRRIVDRVQGMFESFLAAAPTAIMSTDVDWANGLLDIDLSKGMQDLQDHFYFQLDAFPEVYWLYFGHPTGRFVGFRHPLLCEINGSPCPPDGTVPRAQAKNGSKVLTVCQQQGQGMIFSTTDGSSQSLSTLRHDTTWDLSQRGWYNKGAQLAEHSSPYHDDNYAWTDVYVLAGGQELAISAVRKATSSAGHFSGVFGADYSLDFITNFLKSTAAVDKDNTLLFVMEAGGWLIGTNQGSVSKVVNNQHQRIKAEASEIAELAGTARAIHEKHPEYASTDESVWASLITSERNFTATVNGAQRHIEVIGLEVPVGHHSSLKWVVVLSTLTTAFAEVPAEEDGCIGKVACEETLTSTAVVLRGVMLSHLKEAIGSYLGTALSITLGIDTDYNLNKLVPAGSTSASLDFDTNPLQRQVIQKKLFSQLKIFPEVKWVYIGAEHSGRANSFLGYLREGDGIQAWSCAGVFQQETVDCSRAEFWPVDENGVVVGTAPVRVDNTNPTTRTWYTEGATLEYDKYQWTNPYVFGTGEVGISVVRKLLDGDFKETGFRGVLAADFTLSFITTFLTSFQLAPATVSYAMDHSKFLIATSDPAIAVHSPCPGECKLLDARSLSTSEEYSDPRAAIAGSARVLESDSVLIQGTDGQHFVDATRIRDTDTTHVVRSYDWQVVMVTAKNNIYNSALFELSDSSGSTLSDWQIAVMVIGCITAVAVAILAGYLLWKRKNGGDGEATTSPAKPGHDMASTVQFSTSPRPPSGNPNSQRKAAEMPSPLKALPSEGTQLRSSPQGSPSPLAPGAHQALGVSLQLYPRHDADDSDASSGV